jgi:nucleotide-binding universal stress UspA family protein
MGLASATSESVLRPPLRVAPIVIAYDGTPASAYAVLEAAVLLSGRRALVVTVCKPDLAAGLVSLRAATMGLPPAELDVHSAQDVAHQLREAAQRTADQGRVALENDSQAIVVGIEGRGRLGEVLLGRTSRDIIRRAPWPVVVARMARHRTNAGCNHHRH